MNAFDDPAITKKLSFTFTLDQFLIEYCNNVFKNLSNLILEYKIAFVLSSLVSAPKKRPLQIRIEFLTTFYVLKQAIIRKAAKVPDTAVLRYFAALKKEQEDARPSHVKRREQKEKELAQIDKIKKLDAKLSGIDYDVLVKFNNISMGITGDRDDYLIGRQTLIEYGLENQQIRLLKEAFKCKSSFFGFTVQTHNSFEMLYMFANVSLCLIC